MFVIFRLIATWMGEEDPSLRGDQSFLWPLETMDGLSGQTLDSLNFSLWEIYIAYSYPTW